jgi:hypothetical protein
VPGGKFAVLVNGSQASSACHVALVRYTDRVLGAAVDGFGAAALPKTGCLTGPRLALRAGRLGERARVGKPRNLILGFSLPSSQAKNI